MSPGGRWLLPAILTAALLAGAAVVSPQTAPDATATAPEPIVTDRRRTAPPRTWNLGPSIVTRAAGDGGSQTDVTLNYAVALSGAVGGPFSLFGEVYGNFAFGQDVPDSHTVQVGTTILLGRTWQVDVRGGVGMVDNVPDWLAGAGLAFRVPY